MATWRNWVKRTLKNNWIEYTLAPYTIKIMYPMLTF